MQLLLQSFAYIATKNDANPMNGAKYIGVITKRELQHINQFLKKERYSQNK